MLGALLVAYILSLAVAFALGKRRGRAAEGFLLGLGLSVIGVALVARLGPRVAPPQPTRWSRFIAWIDALLVPHTAGMNERTPKARLWVYLLIAGLLALQVLARYKLGFLEDKKFQAVHMLIGWGIVFGVLAAVHGWSFIARISGRTWALLGVAAVCLVVFWYFGRSDSYRHMFGDPPVDHDSWWPIVPFSYFVFGAVFYRLVIPFVFARTVLGITPRELGLPIGKIPSHLHVRGVGWIYLIAFVAIAPALYFASQQPAYLQKYPMNRDIISPENGIWIWHLVVHELLYGLVFLSGESFWRGYLSFGTERDLGFYGLLLMIVPYVTGHFGKPFSETLGAIVAGSLLGYLALKHRSVWLGVALHYGVALAMDLLAVTHNEFVIWR